MKLQSTLPDRAGFIYTVPLLDSILLLLIFFLLGSNFMLKSGIAVDLPVSTSSMPAADRSHIITVAPGELAQIYFNEDRVTLEELDARLAESTEEARHVVLLGDRRSDYGTMMELSQMVLKHGYEVALATQSGD
ncbi:MAG: hypothetical protein HKN23_07305 [Verrucomicrobiales bacterium]|nr:hypothetical protein [Verrucomicrobiales bacterium]